MLVRIPHTSRWLAVPDRRIPAIELTTLIELSDLPAEAARLREQARTQARQAAERLLELARADAAAQASIATSLAAASRARQSEEMASLACHALATLLGDELAGTWQAEVALRIAAGLERRQAVDLLVSPEAVASASDVLSQRLDRAGLTPGVVTVQADTRLEAWRCAVRLGDQAWVVDLEDWLEALAPALASAEFARPVENDASGGDPRRVQGSFDDGRFGDEAGTSEGERG